MSKHLHPYNTISQSKHKNLIKLPNDSDDANVDDNEVGKITSASSNVTQRSVSVQVPDEDINMDVVHVVPCRYYEKEEDMAIDPVNDELCTPKSKKSMATSINESLFHEQGYDFDEMNVGTFNISSNLETHDSRDHPMSKPTDWDNVSISAIVELEMMKEDLEEGIVENLEKLGRLLNLETRHNGKDHSAMECEIAALISVLKEEMDASDDEEDDYHRMSDLDEEYDYWKVNSGVLIWNPPLRVDERSDVPNRKVSQCPTLESIKEEDNGEADMDDDKDNGEDETETQNQRTDAEQKEREQLKEVETIPSKDVKHTMSTEYTSQGLATEVDEFVDMLSSVIISVENESSNRSEIANVTVTSGESFSSGSSETIYEKKESFPQSKMEIIATPSPEHAAVNHSTDHTEPPIEMYSDTISHEYTAKQTVTSSSDEKLGVTDEPSEKTEVLSVPTLNSTSTAADENEREVASAPTLMSSAMQPKPVSTCESKNAKKTRIVTESEDGDDTHSKGGHSPESEACNDEDMENFTKKVRWSDLPFTSTDDSATSTGSTVTVLVPGESNSCNVSVTLTSPSDENLCVTVEPSEKTEMHSVPTLSSTPMRPGAANERQIVSAPTLVSSATQLKQVNSHELKSAKMIRENEELHSAPGAFPSSVTANATFDGGNITAANLNIMDDNDDDDDDNDDEDDNEMVFYAKSGEAVYISPVICSTKLSEKYTIAEVAEENRAGDSSTRNATERKATKSLAAIRRCDQKGSNDLHDQRSRAKRLEPFRAAPKPNTLSEECKIVLCHVRNPNRSKINFDELCTLNNGGTDITPEGLAKTEEGYYPRSRDGQKEQDRSTCDGKHLKRDSCKSASKAQNHVSSLSDTCVHTSDGKTLKRSHKSASEDTCKHEAESVGKKKRKSSKSNLQSKGAAVEGLAKTEEGYYPRDGQKKQDRPTCDGKHLKRGSCKSASKVQNHVSFLSDTCVHTCDGKTCVCECSKSELSSGFLPSYNYRRQSSFSILGIAHTSSVNKVSSEESSRYETNISAFIRCSSDANTSSKYRQAVLKAKSSIGGSVLPSKLTKPKSSVPSFGHGGLNQMATSSEQVKTSRADTLEMSRENDKPNSVVATERPVSVCEKNSRAAMLGLGSKSFTSKVTGTVDLDKMIAAKVNLYKERSERNSLKGIGYSQQSWYKGCEMISEQDSRQKMNHVSVHELAKKPSRSQSDVKLPPLTQPETISLPKIPLTSDGQGLDATAWIRANHDIILRQASRKTAGQGCEVISKQDSRQKMDRVSVHELVKKPSRSQSDVKLPPLTQPKTISLPKIPLTSDGQGLDATAWIRANRDIILRQASRKKAAGHLNSIAKAGCSMSDKSFDKLPQIVKQKNQSLPEMPRGPPSY